MPAQRWCMQTSDYYALILCCSLCMHDLLVGKMLRVLSYYTRCVKLHLIWTEMAPFVGTVWVQSDPAIPNRADSGCLALGWMNRRGEQHVTPGNDLDMDIAYPFSCDDTAAVTVCISRTYDGYTPTNAGSMLPALAGAWPAAMATPQAGMQAL